VFISGSSAGEVAVTGRADFYGVSDNFSGVAVAVFWKVRH